MHRYASLESTQTAQSLLSCDASEARYAGMMASLSVLQQVSRDLMNCKALHQSDIRYTGMSWLNPSGNLPEAMMGSDSHNGQPFPSPQRPACEPQSLPRMNPK